MEAPYFFWVGAPSRQVAMCNVDFHGRTFFRARVEVVAETHSLLPGGDNVQSVRFYLFGERRVSSRC
jgi:hypothetical protein